MCRLLGIETATNVCAVALAENGFVQSVRTLNEPRRHAEQLVPLIEAVLAEMGWTPTSLDAVAVSEGPGSYTGLRIGVSTAKGLAMACDLALVGVPTLQALGSRVNAIPGESILSALRARRDEVFAGLFRVDTSGALTSVRPVQALHPEAALAVFADREAPLILVGDGVGLLREAAGEVPPVWQLHADIKPGAESIAILGTRRFNAGDTVDVEAFEPYYLKPFIARTPTRTMYDRLPF